MPIAAFEGPAGTGKTHNLIEHLQGELANRALAAHERVLALTFMHGARRRLYSRLRDVDVLRRRFHATTLDSFAWRLAQRWRKLAESLGYSIPAEDQYDDTCAVAAALVKRQAVKSWVALSYPIILVDEAQDLSSERASLIAAVAEQCHVILAFDEFQCLNPELLPSAIGAWLPEICTPTRLTICRRTDYTELLEAAHAVRNGDAVKQNGRRFKVALTPGKPNYAATYLANAIAWRGGGNVAILTPSRQGGFADSVVKLVCSHALGKYQNGPFPIEWENSDENELEILWQRFNMPERCSISDAVMALEAHRETPIVRTVRDWLSRRKRVLDINEITASEVRRQFSRTLGARRRHVGRVAAEFVAMTIQQAKNREFDHVVIIWPYTIPNDDEQKRRLLYNAITRAKRSCLVLVQAQELLIAPPFR